MAARAATAVRTGLGVTYGPVRLRAWTGSYGRVCTYTNVYLTNGLRVSKFNTRFVGRTVNITIYFDNARVCTRGYRTGVYRYTARAN